MRERVSCTLRGRSSGSVLRFQGLEQYLSCLMMVCKFMEQGCGISWRISKCLRVRTWISKSFIIYDSEMSEREERGVKDFEGRIVNLRFIFADNHVDHSPCVHVLPYSICWKEAVLEEPSRACKSKFSYRETIESLF